MQFQNPLFVLNIISEPDENSLFREIVKQYIYSHEQIVCNKGTQLHTNKILFITFITNNKSITDMNARYYDISA